MNFPDETISKYSESLSQGETAVLAELNRETYAKVLMPQMLSGGLQGRILAMFSKMIQPARILEIGTFTGYSGICLCEGLKESGKLYTIDINEELEDMVRTFFKKAGLENQIDYRIGNAIDIVPTLDEEFDLVFIDADKNNYLNYYNLIFDRVKKGGYIIADNVLWSGKILDAQEDMDADTKALYDYAHKVKADVRVETLLLPVRDGLMIARKIV